MKIKMQVISPIGDFNSMEKEVTKEQYESLVRIINDKSLYCLNIELDDKTIVYLKNDILNNSAIIINILEKDE